MTDQIKSGGELQPCPFCGDGDYLIVSHTRATQLVQWWQVECGCHASGGAEATREEAIAAWNTRTPAKAGEDGVTEAGDACFIAADPVASPDEVDEDDNPLWTAEVQTVGGWSVVATVWGASPEQASARAITVASALSSIEEPRG